MTEFVMKYIGGNKTKQRKNEFHPSDNTKITCELNFSNLFDHNAIDNAFIIDSVLLCAECMCNYDVHKCDQRPFCCTNTFSFKNGGESDGVAAIQTANKQFEKSGKRFKMTMWACVQIYTKYILREI